jgi:hypothetical protein
MGMEVGRLGLNATGLFWVVNLLNFSCLIEWKTKAQIQ